MLFCSKASKFLYKRMKPLTKKLNQIKKKIKSKCTETKKNCYINEIDKIDENKLNDNIDIKDINHIKNK